jgi:hypothetical protein
VEKLSIGFVKFLTYFGVIFLENVQGGTFWKKFPPAPPSKTFAQGLKTVLSVFK